MSRKGQTVTLSLSQSDKEQLEAIALELGMTWGDRPNISKLVQAIARKQLSLAPNNDWPTSRLDVLAQCVRALTDLGKLAEAQVVAKLLLERHETSWPMRQEMERFVGNPPPPWREEIDGYIRRQQPFRLFYQDATGRPWTFTVRHAQINLHEGGQYLDCWCEETEGNLDLPELIHNWSLRLDRIVTAGVAPIQRPWRSHMDSLRVEMHLFDRLAFAYAARIKSEDEFTEWLPDSGQVLRVVKKISNTYWFIREVMPQAQQCLVISPQNLRDRLQQQLVQICQLYGITTQP
ncbi:YafY family protein [[Phormidium] sp. ETS-05]|uniref:helix-turn-helix transcriptional regulator n=1 Tax=[Phormidium] sp. ETS-05 TaxID=222819 RepID=UPI0018EF3128|nr:WYL domain-containing protein [[Phormidium] sp. ETS-05]